MISMSRASVQKPCYIYSSSVSRKHNTEASLHAKKRTTFRFRFSLFLVAKTDMLELFVLVLLKDGDRLYFSVTLFKINCKDEFR